MVQEVPLNLLEGPRVVCLEDFAGDFARELAREFAGSQGSWR